MTLKSHQIAKEPWWYERRAIELRLPKRADAVLALKGDGLVKGIDDLSDLLIELYGETDPTWRSIDRAVKDSATYFLLPYADTHDLARSLKIHGIIQSLVRHLMLLDSCFDEDAEDRETSRAKAAALWKEVLAEIDDPLKRALRYGMAALWPIADVERQIKAQVSRGQAFTRQEILFHLHRKSSDVPMLYAEVLAHSLNKLGPNVVQILHCNQALLDLFDDIDDVAEDLRHGSNNILVMACVGGRLFREGRLNGCCSVADIRKESSAVVLSLVSDYEEWIAAISVPRQFAFLKELSQCYLEKARMEGGG